MAPDSKPITTTTVIKCTGSRVLIQNAEGEDCQVSDYELYYDKVIKTQDELKAEFPDFYHILSLPTKSEKTKPTSRGSN